MKHWMDIKNGGDVGAVCAYRISEIEDLIAKLRDLIHQLKCADWGDAGTLGHIVGVLEELTEG